MAVDGFHFLDPATRATMRAWHEREPRPTSTPWTPLGRPLSQARVALISTAGIAHVDDKPFDQEGERQNPWWGDPTHRVLAREVTTEQIRVYHLHIDPRPAEKDLDTVLPLRRLDELVEAGTVGSSSPEHYSMMGYILQTEDLVDETAPKMVDALIRQEVDLALFVPV